MESEKDREGKVGGVDGKDDTAQNNTVCHEETLALAGNIKSFHADDAQGHGAGNERSLVACVAGQPWPQTLNRRHPSPNRRQDQAPKP